MEPGKTTKFGLRESNPRLVGSGVFPRELPEFQPSAPSRLRPNHGHANPLHRSILHCRRGSRLVEKQWPDRFQNRRYELHDT